MPTSASTPSGAPVPRDHGMQVGGSLVVEDPRPLATRCALGCTETCPGGATEHAAWLRTGLLPRMRSEWWPLRRQGVVGSSQPRNVARHRRPGVQRPRPALHEPGMLPPGWSVHASLPTTNAYGEYLHLVRAPTRRDESGAFVAGLWALMWNDRRPQGEGASVLIIETNLWRLRLYYAYAVTNRWNGPAYSPSSGVGGWLDTVIADLADPADPAEQAERTLFLLSGRWRTPPAASLR